MTHSLLFSIKFVDLKDKLPLGKPCMSCLSERFYSCLILLYSIIDSTEGKTYPPPPTPPPIQHCACTGGAAVSPSLRWPAVAAVSKPRGAGTGWGHRYGICTKKKKKFKCRQMTKTTMRPRNRVSISMCSLTLQARLKLTLTLTSNDISRHVRLARAT